jgi:hypothetical protein
MNTKHIQEILQKLEKHRPLIHPLAEKACIQAGKGVIDTEAFYWNARMGADFMELFARKNYVWDSDDFHQGVTIVWQSDLVRELGAEVDYETEVFNKNKYMGVIYQPGDRPPSAYGLVSCTEHLDPTDFWESTHKHNLKIENVR